jgi:hypothetical protein
LSIAISGSHSPPSPREILAVDPLRSSSSHQGFFKR